MDTCERTYLFIDLEAALQLVLVAVRRLARDCERVDDCDLVLVDGLEVDSKNVAGLSRVMEISSEKVFFEKAGDATFAQRKGTFGE